MKRVDLAGHGLYQQITCKCNLSTSDNGRNKKIQVAGEMPVASNYYASRNRKSSRQIKNHYPEAKWAVVLAHSRRSTEAICGWLLLNSNTQIH